MKARKQVVVAVSAHADDAELNAGGTLAKWVAEGGTAHIVMMTNNCSGPLVPENGDETAQQRLGPVETSRIRQREQDAAANLLGATMHYLNYYQRHFWNGQREVSIGYEPAIPLPDGLDKTLPILIACNERDHINRLAQTLSLLQPDLVLTQTPADRDPEHHAVATMVWEAFSRHPALQHIPLRFWASSTASPGGLFNHQYDVVEDISYHYPKKVELCACHASQMTSHRYDIVARRAAYWGRRLGVAYAEPFRTAHWDELLL